MSELFWAFEIGLGHRGHPTGRSVSVVWVHLRMVWAWMLWEWDALKHEHYLLGRGCPGDRKLSNMNAVFLHEGPEMLRFRGYSSCSRSFARL